MRNVRPLVQIVHVSDIGLAEKSGGSLTPDAYARAAFARFMLSLTAGDAVWRKHPSWFVASRIARNAAVEFATTLDFLDAVAPRTAFRSRVVLPGPLDPRTPESAPVVWPAPPVTERSFDGRTELQLYALDTHDGVVDAASFARLVALESLHRGDAQTTPVRVLVSHHPVPALLRESARRIPGPLAHLHLAAHTPRVEPLRVTTELPHFVSPGAWSSAEPPWSGTASVLRLYAAVVQPGVVLCERFVAARAAVSGEWRFRTGDNGEITQEWVLRG